MKTQIHKNTIIFIIATAVVFTIAIVTYLLLTQSKTKYPDQKLTPILTSSTNENIQFSNSQFNNSESLIWGISNNVQLENTKKFVNELNQDFTLVDEQTGNSYKWTNERNDEILYDVLQNQLIFSIKSGVSWDEAELTKYSFSNFVKQYFSQTWTYIVFTNEIRNTGEKIYYAKRVLEDHVLETQNHFNETDMLALKDGKIVYGKLLLADIFKTEIKVPLINSNQLSEKINERNYPKEIFPDYSSLQSNLLTEVDYKSEDFEEIVNTLNSCKSTTTEIVYLYKGNSQSSLLPVYKLGLTCEVTYKNQTYTTSGTGYVNAIDSQYVNIPE